MVDFITGPMVWISCLFFLAGTIYQVYSIKKLTRKVRKADKKKVVPDKTDSITKESLNFKIRMLKYSFIGIHREKIVLSILFHVLIIFTPLLVPAHNILLKQSFGFSLLSLPESLIDLTTILVILCFAVFLLRRIFVERVRAISSFSDYAILIIVAAPFVTGLLSCQQFFDSRTIYLIHILTGEIMLIALPLTKLVHMIFFFFGPLISIHKQTFGNGKEILRSEG